MKKSILKSSIALAVAGVFGATVAVTAAEPTTPVPIATQDVKAPVAQDTVVPAAANLAAATPAIENAAVANAAIEAKVVRTADKKVEANKDEKNTKKAQAHKAPKVKADKADKAVKETKRVKADKKETTKEEKKTLKVENHNLAQQVSKQA